MLITPGFGLRDLHRVTDRARRTRGRCGVERRDGGRALTVRHRRHRRPAGAGDARARVDATGPAGVETRTRARRACWRPAAASGRGRPGSVPGDRPAGVLTTGELQQLVYLGTTRRSAARGRRRRRARQLLGGADAARTAAPAWSRWSPSMPRQQTYAGVPARRARCAAGARCVTGATVTRLVGPAAG